MDAVVSLQSLLLIIAAATINVTISTASLFGPVRDWIEGHSEFFGKLINCDYCFAHWVAAFFVAAYYPAIIGFTPWIVVLWFVFAFATYVIGRFIQRA